MTIIQKQCLLKYLGYYTGNIDGDWGAKSTAATEELQEDNGIKVDGIFGEVTEEIAISAVFYGKFKNQTTSNKDSNKETTDSGDWWDNIKYFERHEFACKCGKCGGFPVEPARGLVEFLDDFREEVGLPVYINSGIRCKAHNAAVGGSADSRHLYGDAADIRCPGKTPREMYNIAERLIGNSGGVGLYSWGIHGDKRGHKARWNG